MVEIFPQAREQQSLNSSAKRKKLEDIFIRRKLGDVTWPRCDWSRTNSVTTTTSLSIQLTCVIDRLNRSYVVSYKSNMFGIFSKMSLAPIVSK